jgi:hypothetical protein
MSSGYRLVSISFTLGQSKVLEGVGFRAIAAAAAYAGGLIANSVSDSSIRFHERSRFLLLQIIPFFLPRIYCKRRMSKPANPGSGLCGSGGKHLG